MSLEQQLEGRGIPDEAIEALRTGQVGGLIADGSRIHEANDRFLELVGYSRDALEAGALSWLRMTTPQWLADDARAIGQLRSTGRADVYEKSFVRHDGGEVRVRLADLLLELDPLRIFAFVADAGDTGERAIVDAVDAATR